jgi:ABC-type nitrate/sulfonate/bicarbonate transport system ATPase subunit
MPKLELRDIAMTYTTRRGAQVTAIERLSLEVAERSFVSIVGPSGCGKSTLLRVAAGLMRPTSGEVLVDGRGVTAPSADRGMIFQSYTLFPWLTVRQNVEFGPRQRGINGARRTAIARRYIDLVGLNGFDDAYPKELSGGMMQRVALARALANDPQVLLMDEPFGALDAQTRVVMQELLVDLWQRQPKTILFVTHDIEEALFLSDRIYVMSARPGAIKAELSVPFARPRSLATSQDPSFHQLKREIFALIRPELNGSRAAVHAVRDQSENHDVPDAHR